MNCRRERIKSMKLRVILAAVNSHPDRTIRVEFYILYSSFITNLFYLLNK